METGYPSTLAVNSGSGNRALEKVQQTGLGDLLTFNTDIRITEAAFLTS